MEGACGDREAVKKLGEQARVVIEYIAAHAGELLDMSLAHPAVARVLIDL